VLDVEVLPPAFGRPAFEERPKTRPARVAENGKSGIVENGPEEIDAAHEVLAVAATAVDATGRRDRSHPETRGNEGHRTLSS